jgi:hypothetical protein
LKSSNVRGSKNRGYDARKAEAVANNNSRRRQDLQRSHDLLLLALSPAGHSNAAGMCPMQAGGFCSESFTHSFREGRIARSRSAVLLLLMNYNRYLAITELTVPRSQPYVASRDHTHCHASPILQVCTLLPAPSGTRSVELSTLS